ncbi:phosphotransferase family protein [Agromyces sp. SYSU T0242]|uniref:phosphotransferase family protein n=1 Tax=Agromyces litoreus TaxID=3158561 RepID=UPI00339488DF
MEPDQPAATPEMHAVARRFANGRGRDVAGVARLGGGMANEVAIVTLDDGTRVVAKLAPADGGGLSHERALLPTEALALAALATPEVAQPVPLEQFAVRGRDALVMTELPGAPRVGGVPRDGLGRAVGAMHLAGARVDGVRFGYPHRPELQARSAREGYLCLVDAALADARRFEVGLGRPVAEVRDRLAAAASAFDSVHRPTLVHFDLWDGNVLLDDGDGDRAERISGFVDHERAMWADPTADLASLALFTPVPEAILADAAFCDGYLAGTGRSPLEGDGAVERARLWAAYLAILMIVEAVPRRYSGDWFVDQDARTRAWFDATLDAIGGSAG